ncbi:hypothetical protein C8F04DRAFT_1122111, partial [Mycena alexandri]
LVSCAVMHYLSYAFTHLLAVHLPQAFVGTSTTRSRMKRAALRSKVRAPTCPSRRGVPALLTARARETSALLGGEESSRRVPSTLFFLHFVSISSSSPSPHHPLASPPRHITASTPLIRRE